MMFKHRSQFLGVSLLFMTLLLTFGAFVPVQAGTTPAFQDTILGVRLALLPQGTKVVTDQYLSSAYGFTVVDAERRLQARVEWLYNASPAKMGQMVNALMESFPGIQTNRSQISIGGYKATVLSPVPGQVETSAVFVSANGRLYRIFYNTEGDAGAETLQYLTFVPPTGDIHSLHLQRAEDALYVSPPWDWQIDSRKPQSESDVMNAPEMVAPPQINTASGCVDFPTWKFLQTQWAWNANGTGTPYSQGWSKAGPSYFGEGLHQGCDRATRLNDYYALDHPLKEWDIVYPPASGTVIYAGWTGGGWAGLGRVVIIDLGNGYWAMAAHLRGINVTVGQSVDISTVIGWAGGSGYYQDNYWSVHLHQGLYKDANLASWAGGIYGGHSAQPVKVHYFGNGGDYWYISKYQWMSW